MNGVSIVRRAHVVCTALVGVQLVIWTVTGLGFTLTNFDDVRGAQERAPAPLLAAAPRLSLDVALAQARAMAPAEGITEARVRSVAGRPTYVVAFASGGDPVLVGEDGRVRRGIDANDALAIATAAHATAAPVTSFDRLTREGDAPDLEVPVFRACFADGKGTCAFVSPKTGELVAFRNDAWRSFDRLYSLHVLAYVNRSTPAHAPLRVLAALAVLAVASGAALLGLKFRARVRSKLALRDHDGARAPRPLSSVE